MRNTDQIRWLYEQLPTWIEQGIITPSNADRLRETYGKAEDKPAYNLVFLIASVLGAVLIGGGIILIFAYNWEHLSRAWRTFFSILPLFIAQLFYGYAYFKKQDSLAWVEATSAFLMLMLASSIALISQTYNLGGSLSDFLLSWLLLSVPLMYLMNASLVAIIYMFGIVGWASSVSWVDNIGYWGLLALAIPHLAFNIRPLHLNYRSTLLGWVLIITLYSAYVIVENLRIAEYNLIKPAVLISFFYFLGEIVYRQGKNAVQRPFQTAAIGMMLVLGFVLCFEWFISKTNVATWADVFYSRRPESALNTLNFFLLIAAAIGYIGICVYLFGQKRWVNPFVALFPIMVQGGIFLVRDDKEWAAIVLANLFWLTFGVYYVYRGIQERVMPHINLGMLVLAALIVIRFFNSDWDFVVKGVVFILLGAAFLSVNIILPKRLKE